ncbi:MAG TPA: pyridoxal-dependent decarboxylase [Thermoanaerobaculia bacterium]|nr:pyridoxal-dependent decarboxylase [Thermoanaerobaculia bacterium]
MSRDLPSEDFRAAMHRVADLVADYLEGVGEKPVLPPVSPGEVRGALPPSAPEGPEPLDAILDDYLRLIEPNVTHWNHPGFLAYFSITGSGPGIVGETLAAALNVNAMLWRTGPAPTELEERVCEWLAQMMELPPDFRGHVNDTASSSSLVALAAARHRLPLDVRVRGLAGRAEVPPLTVYCSDQAHSSIDKSAIVLGVGQENVRRIASDGDFRMSVPALAQAVARDRAAGYLPMAIVATVGTTSSTSIDPVAEIADLCAREGIWLHVDAAYAGSAAICPEYRALMTGIERADSLVVNPHKWLFTPVDCSVLFVRDPGLLKGAFSLVPEYLRTAESSEVTNLMDLGFQLGRRFRALKLWMVIRAFGAEGLRERIRAHCAMARELAARVEADPRFELAAPVPFSTVCFRARVEGMPEDQDRFNERLLTRINAAGPFFLSHTGLQGRYTLRVAIGNLRTEPAHLAALWELVGKSADELRAPPSP